MARKLRIAVSMFFGLLTVALCVLWVRSYYGWRPSDDPLVYAPYRMIVPVLAALAVAPLASVSFSFRALHIVITLIAVALGLVVWAAR